MSLKGLTAARPVSLTLTGSRLLGPREFEYRNARGHPFHEFNPAHMIDQLLMPIEALLADWWPPPVGESDLSRETRG